jgi:Ca-activated chloride channel family protein
LSGRLAPALLLAGWAAALPLAPAEWILHPHLPVWAERWLYNPRERTAAAIEATHAGDPRRAAELADTAGRLAPTDPLTRFNAGTARLSARRSDALPELEEASKRAAADLAPAAAYNLGNGRLAAGDAAGAAEAFKQALRLNPTDADAKYNLELALARRDRDRLRTRSPREGRRGDRPGGEETARGTASDQPADRQQQPGASDPGRSPQQGNSAQASQGAPGQPNEMTRRQPLPGYTNQPEMSAAEAAAVLQAVENLERQQRREKAARLARQRAKLGKDW